MDNLERNFESKFGPPPPTMLPPHVVLVGQAAACVALLTVLQPPFALAPPETTDGVSRLCAMRVLVASATTTGATWLLHVCGARPADTFRGACELLVKACAR